MQKGKIDKKLNIEEDYYSDDCKQTKLKKSLSDIDKFFVDKKTEQSEVNVERLVIANLPENVDEKDVIYYWETSKQDLYNEFEDLAREYLVVQLKDATGGLVVYAKHSGGWEANPYNYRSLIRKLLTDLGKFRL